MIGNLNFTLHSEIRRLAIRKLKISDVWNSKQRSFWNSTAVKRSGRFQRLIETREWSHLIEGVDRMSRVNRGINGPTIDRDTYEREREGEREGGRCNNAIRARQLCEARCHQRCSRFHPADFYVGRHARPEIYEAIVRLLRSNVWQGTRNSAIRGEDLIARLIARVLDALFFKSVQAGL